MNDKMMPGATLASSSQLSGWDASFPRKVFGQRACWGLSTARRKYLVGRLFKALRNDRNNTVLLRINWFLHVTHDKPLPPVFAELHNFFETVVNRLRQVAASTQRPFYRRRADGT
jgi:hypothetical protein